MTVEPKYSSLRDNDEQTIDIDEVSKHNPKTTASRDYWDQFLGELNAEVRSELVIKNIADETHPRTGALIGVETERVDEVADMCDEYDVYLHEREFEVLGNDFNAHGTFPNYHFHGPYDLIKEFEPESVLRVVGVDEETATEFVDALLSESEEDYKRAGEIKGIPDCCIAHQLEHQQHSDVDRLYETTCSTESSRRVESEIVETITVDNLNPLMNVAWRFRGWSFLQHTPCSFDCEHSTRLAERNYESMHELGYGDRADGLLSWLDLSTTWDAYHGIARVRNAYSIGTYTSDDYWLKSIVYLHAPHDNTPEMEHVHNTDVFKKVVPDLPPIPKDE